MKIDANLHQYAVYCYSDSGPVFGNCYGIWICLNANLTDCSSELGFTYKNPQYAVGTNELVQNIIGWFSKI